MASLRGEARGFCFCLIFFFFYYLFLAIWVFVAAAGTFSRYGKWGCSLGVVHRLFLMAASLSQSSGSAAQAQWSWHMGLAVREAIPRQVDRKSGVREEERGVWKSQGGGGQTPFVSLRSLVT